MPLSRRESDPVAAERAFDGNLVNEVAALTT